LTEFRTTWGEFFHPVGTRKKRKKKDLVDRRDSDSDDDAVDFGTSGNSGSECADSSDVEDDIVLPNKTVNKKVEATEMSPAGSSKWMEMLARLDNRTTPPLEKFDEDSGQQLRSYLRRFEAFCADNFRGGRDLWIGQLEQKWMA